MSAKTKVFSRAIFATACSLGMAWLGGAATLVAAQTNADAGPAAISQGAAHSALAAQQVRAASGRAALKAQQAKGAGLPPGNASPAEIFINSYRAYPPSCLNNGVPFGSSAYSADPNRVQKQVTLIGDPLSGDPTENTYTENVTVTIFRVACTSGKSATVIEIDRDPNFVNTNFYPVFPNIYIPVSATTVHFPRLADDPNTFLATNFALSPLINSDSYVFENDYGIAPAVDYNQAMTVTVDNFIQGPNETTDFIVPTYNPAQYAAASQPLLIGGYQSGAWYDPAHGGEGMLIQVYDNGDQKTRTFYAQWFTYDPQGRPFWLVAQGNINIGDNKVTNAVTQYLTGGGFAGSVKANNRQTWGTMSFQFSDCNTLQFTYSGQTDAATNGPSGTGTRTWSRLGNINGLFCGP